MNTEPDTAGLAAPGSAADATLTKGERTAGRILDAAELVFAERGFEAATLREIARRVGIREPGLYNHFSNKRELYAAVLDRALTPMLEAMHRQLDSANVLRAHAGLPELMMDLLAAHPAMAALFQQALRDEPGNQLLMEWLDRLFDQGLDIMQELGSEHVDRAELALQTIAMFNLCTGYVLSRRAFTGMTGDELYSEENLERQKKLLRKFQRALLLG